MISLSTLDPRNHSLGGRVRIDLTSIDLTRLDLRRIALPEMPGQEQIVGAVRDAAYVAVGAAVVAARTADERAREFAELAGGRLRQLVDAVA